MGILAFSIFSSPFILIALAVFGVLWIWLLAIRPRMGEIADSDVCVCVCVCMSVCKCSVWSFVDMVAGHAAWDG